MGQKPERRSGETEGRVRGAALMLEKAEKKRAGLTRMNEERKQQDADKETRQKTKRGARGDGMTRDQSQNRQDVVFRASSPPPARCHTSL